MRKIILHLTLFERTVWNSSEQKGNPSTEDDLFRSSRSNQTRCDVLCTKVEPQDSLWTSVQVVDSHYCHSRALFTSLYWRRRGDSFLNNLKAVVLSVASAPFFYHIFVLLVEFLWMRLDRKFWEQQLLQKWPFCVSLSTFCVSIILYLLDFHLL